MTITWLLLTSPTGNAEHHLHRVIIAINRRGEAHRSHTQEAIRPTEENDIAIDLETFQYSTEVC